MFRCTVCLEELEVIDESGQFRSHMGPSVVHRLTVLQRFIHPEHLTTTTFYDISPAHVSLVHDAFGGYCYAPVETFVCSASFFVYVYSAEGP